jgi:hypothetical protein
VHYALISEVLKVSSFCQSKKLAEFDIDCFGKGGFLDRLIDSGKARSEKQENWF